MTHSPKKIIFILPNLLGGGAERVTVHLMKLLDRDEFEPILFLLKNEGSYFDELPENIKVVFGLEASQRILHHLPRLVARLLGTAKGAHLIVGALELIPTYLAYLVGKILGIPAIGWVHTNLDRYAPAKKLAHRVLCRWVYPRIKAIITVSEGVSEGLKNKIKALNPSAVHTIYNPLPVLKIRELASEADDFPIPKIPYILGIGRLERLKRFDLLIEAHAALKKKSIPQQLWILGAGPERKALEDLCLRLQVQDSVAFLGFKANPYALIKGSQVLALSSESEGLPTVMLEAMALGVPVVATDCRSGPREILDNGKYGLLVENKNLAQIIDALEKVFRDPRLSQELGRLGALRSMDFNPEAIIPQFEKLFLEAMS